MLKRRRFASGLNYDFLRIHLHKLATGADSVSRYASSAYYGGRRKRPADKRRIPNPGTLNQTILPLNRSHRLESICNALRTPLLWNIECLGQILALSADADLKRQCGVMLRNCEQMLLLLNQLVDLFKADACQIAPLISGQNLGEGFAGELIREPLEIPLISMDEQFLRKATEAVQKHLSNPDFDVQFFLEEVAMSRMQLHRKLKSLTDQSATGFIRTLRLRHAAFLLENKTGNITDIAYEVGFSNLSYFTRSFHRLFGQSPRAYAARHRTY